MKRGNQEKDYDDYLLVWYHKGKDVIFMSSYLDALFCALQPINWKVIECLGHYGKSK